MAEHGRIIAIFADGTGNGSSALFRTNVWRLYKALDLSCPKQVAYYHDGVGSSSFKPWAILGGVFGVGLKRNLLDIYAFICRSYRPGDRIMVFGFSRGAFTVRMLVGLLASQGVLRNASDRQLSIYTRDAYRAFRKGIGSDRDEDRRGFSTPLTGIFRWLRDEVVVRAVRRLSGNDPYVAISETAHPTNLYRHRLYPGDVALVGVWDTVAAYGLPFDELTHGIDRWLWPMSFPDYELSPIVARGAHALALDDERNTFHPLVWDETREGDRERLHQVWFAGMHADVGGGYPDDGLAHLPLLWMLEQAKEIRPEGADAPERPGLIFAELAVQEIQNRADPLGRLNDSRKGMGGYYRLQPRKLQPLLEPSGQVTIQRNPATKTATLAKIRLHESVLRRIASGVRNYAPSGIPAEYEVVVDGNPARAPVETKDNAQDRARRQETVWNTIWWRRVGYFATLLLSLALAAMPIYGPWIASSACLGPECLVVPLIGPVKALAPEMLWPWLDSFGKHPRLFLVLVAILIMLLLWGGHLQRLARDQMRKLWMRSLVGETVQEPLPDVPEGGLYRLRTSAPYQWLFGTLKWKVIPALAAIVTFLIGIVLVVGLPTLGIQRGRLAMAQDSAAICQPPEERTERFDTRNFCWRTGTSVAEGQDYRITLTVQEPWQDGSIATDPAGFLSSRFPFWLRPAWLVRRSLDGRWFQPGIMIIDEARPGSQVDSLMLEVQQESGTANRFSGRFTATGDGMVHLFVNDVVIGMAGITRWFYANNKGTAQVEILKVTE